MIIPCLILDGEQMDRIKLTGIGNGVVDAIVSVSEADFAALGYKKGSSLLVDKHTQDALLKRFGANGMTLSSGGSVANTVATFAMLGGSGAFLSSMGDDQYGRHFLTELADLKIEFVNQLWKGGMTATAVVLVTPDGERTMRLCLGDAVRMAPALVDQGLISRSEWLLIEGYLLANGADSHEAVRRAVTIARSSGTKIALSLSEAWVVQSQAAIVNELVKVADLVFMNRDECAALNMGSPEQVVNEFAREKRSAIVTLSADGAIYSLNGSVGRSAAVPCTPVDATGAGDVFCALVIAGIVNQQTPEKIMRRAAAAATAVITQVGARLSSERLNDALSRVS